MCMYDDMYVCLCICICMYMYIDMYVCVYICIFARKSRMSHVYVPYFACQFVLYVRYSVCVCAFFCMYAMYASYFAVGLYLYLYLCSYVGTYACMTIRYYMYNYTYTCLLAAKCHPGAQKPSTLDLKPSTPPKKNSQEHVSALIFEDLADS